MKNSEIRNALGEIRIKLDSIDHSGLRESCRKYANHLCEAKPGRFIRKESLEVLKRAKEVVG